MNVLVVADGHYCVTPDGTVYADSVYDYAFYKRYLQVYDHVFAVVRARVVDDVPKNKKKSSGNGVTFLFMPVYQGPYEYILKYISIKRFVSKVCNDERMDCAIFRIPAATSNIFCKEFKKTHKPFSVEVVTDPWENFGPKASGNKFMLYIVRRSWTRLVKDMCDYANGASYVTYKYLQRKYPPRCYREKNNNTYFTASYSSVELQDNSFAIEKKWSADQMSFTIAHVSNYFSDYGKGHLTLMEAVKTVRDHGLDAKICFVGDGPMRQEFEECARKLGIAEAVTFTGRLANGDEVRKVIASADIFALPTFAEGLPRVLLEAMAEGLPCLSSPICGIPEILDIEFLFDFEDSNGFARGIENFINNVELMNKEGKRNLLEAKKYSASELNKRRKEFYFKLRKLTEEMNLRRTN